MRTGKRLSDVQGGLRKLLELIISFESRSMCVFSFENFLKKCKVGFMSEAQLPGLFD